MSLIGSHIRTNRLRSGMSLKKLANKMKVTPQFLCRFENSDYLPSKKYLDKYVEYLKLDQHRVNELISADLMFKYNRG